MNQPTLSICIPTYNRAKYIGDCLESVVSQFEDKNICDQMEIVISDNGSTDDTSLVIKAYTDKWSNIKYFKNEINIGFDRNILQVVEKSSGMYCLPIGDDDAFFPGSFSILLQKLAFYKKPYYLLNGWGYDHELMHPIVSHPNRQVKEDRVYGSLAEFVRSISNYTDLVGNFGSMSHLFNREMWLRFDKAKDYIGTQTVHLYIVLTVFKNESCALIAEPVIKTRNDNMRWDSFPGLEKGVNRAMLTAKGVMWISDLYDLSLSTRKVTFHFLVRAYWISFKEFVKKILFGLGLRK